MRSTPAAGDLLNDLRQRGVKLSANGDQLVIDAPHGTLTNDDVDALRQLKPLLLAMLKNRMAPHRCDRADWTDRRVKKRRPDAPTDPQGDWLQTKCIVCGRFFGYRPSVN